MLIIFVRPDENGELKRTEKNSRISQCDIYRNKSVASGQMKWRALLFVHHIDNLCPMILSLLGIVAITSKCLDMIKEHRRSSGMSPLTSEMQRCVARRVDRPYVSLPLQQQFDRVRLSSNGSVKKRSTSGIILCLESRELGTHSAYYQTRALHRTRSRSNVQWKATSRRIARSSHSLTPKFIYQQL